LLFWHERERDGNTGRRKAGGEQTRRVTEGTLDDGMARRSPMTGYCLFDAELCDRAAGWEKGESPRVL